MLVHKRGEGTNTYDIATETGASASTVSRMLNNKENVGPKIKDRVETVLRKYDYKPSAIARGMVPKTVGNIIILTVNVRVTHYARMICVIKQEFSNLGYNVSVCNTGGSIQECNRYFEISSEKQTDGIVLIGSVFNELIKYPEITAKIKGTPVVIANGQVKLPNFYPVLVGDTKATRMASDHMFDHGRTNLFYVFDIATNSGRTGRQDFLEAMKLRDAPGGNDRVSEDIAITGYNSSSDSRMCKPELAILDSRPKLLNGMYASLLRDGMEGKESVASVVIQPELMVRGSGSF